MPGVQYCNLATPNLATPKLGSAIAHLSDRGFDAAAKELQDCTPGTEPAFELALELLSRSPINVGHIGDVNCYSDGHCEFIGEDGKPHPMNEN